MAKKSKTAESFQKMTATVYIGKSLQGLPTYTVFKDGILPPHIEQMIIQKPVIRGLIVPVEELQKARQDITRKGHILNTLANKI